MNSPDLSAPGKRTRTRKSTSNVSAAVDGGAPGRRRAAVEPVSPDDRRRMIEVCAYFIAEQRGFAPGCDQQDWLEAESRIDTMLASARAGATRRAAPRTRQ